MSVHMINRVIQRRQSEKINSVKTMDNHIDFIKSKLLKGMDLNANITARPMVKDGDDWLLTLDLEITRADKGKGKLNEPQIDKLLDEICNNVRWNKYAFVNQSTNPDKYIDPDTIQQDSPDTGTTFRDIIPFDEALTWEALEFDYSLIHADDNTIENHPAFQGLYDRAAHIRIALGAIHHAILTGGAVRNHVMYFGPVGSAKTSMVEAILKLFPENAYIKIHAESASNAGYRKVFLKGLSETGVPPIMVMEEIDKCLEDNALAPFLSVLDRRGRLQQLNARFAGGINAPVLCIATANNKERVDKMLSGAIASRFNKSLYVPSPNRLTLQRILKREIITYGGDENWIRPALDLAEELGYTDPRMTMSLLDGRERLIDGSYRADMLRTSMAVQQLKDINAGIMDEPDHKELQYQKAMEYFRKNGFQG